MTILSRGLAIHFCTQFKYYTGLLYPLKNWEKSRLLEMLQGFKCRKIDIAVSWGGKKSTSVWVKRWWKCIKKLFNHRYRVVFQLKVIPISLDTFQENEIKYPSNLFLGNILWSIRPRSGKIKPGWPRWLCGYEIIHTFYFTRLSGKSLDFYFLGGTHLNGTSSNIFMQWVSKHSHQASRSTSTSMILKIMSFSGWRKCQPAYKEVLLSHKKKNWREQQNQSSE